MATWLTHVSLVDGALPVVVTILAALAAVALMIRRRPRRWWWAVVLVGVPVAAVGSAFALAALLVDGLDVWPEALPPEVVAWGGLAVGGVLLAGLAVVVRPFRWWRVIVAPVCVLLLAAEAGLQVNAYYGAFPTAADLLGQGPAAAWGIPSALMRHRPDAVVRGAVADGWHAPAGMATTGLLRQVDIPGTASHFTGRPALVYLPGAYLLRHRPKLPVLVLVAGQPGSPSSWTSAGRVRQTVDGFAAAHHGLAPVVVIPDPNGSSTANTMCMNSALGNADTYLSVDVPAWITSTLDVDDNPAHWVAGGFSYGGTCAVQLGTRHPDRYRSILALAAEREPALAVDRRKTVATAFGGDTAAFDRLVPLTLLRVHRYPASSAYFAAGSTDPVYQQNAAVLQAAAAGAGMRTRLVTIPGSGHSYVFARAGLLAGLDFLAPALGLTR